MSIAPGWYKDPVEPTTQRWWDGEGWVGESLPADATPPPGPPPDTETPLEPAAPPVPSGSTRLSAKSGIPPGHEPEPEKPAGGPPGAPPRPHGFPLATLGARLVARLIDVGLLFLLNVVVNGWFVYRYVDEIAPLVSETQRRLLAGEGLSDLPDATEAQTYLLVILIIATALWFAYEIPAVANTGQTPGKRLMGIQVVRLEGDQPAGLGPAPGQPAPPPPLGFGRSFRRWNTMGLPTLLWWCFGIGFLLQLVDVLFALFDRPLQQALHDKSAHTVVIAVPSEPSPPQEPGASDAPTDPS